jgi:hypothetical protein
MTKANFSSIAEIEKVLDVDILDSPDAYTGAKGLYEYWPAVKDGKLYSATIMNSLYSIGDLKNFRADIDAHDYSDVSFERGEKYSLPIYCEITIRGERNDGTEETVFEKMNSLDLVDEGVEIIKYKPAQIDAEVAVYTITDKQMLIGLLADIESGKIEQGDVAPASREGEEDTVVTIAQFVYNNVSYFYSTNELSIDDMKAFLDTLALE